MIKAEMEIVYNVQGKADEGEIMSVPLSNMTSAAPLSVVLSLLSQRKEGKRGRSVRHV